MRAPSAALVAAALCGAAAAMSHAAATAAAPRPRLFGLVEESVTEDDRTGDETLQTWWMDTESGNGGSGAPLIVPSARFGTTCSVGFAPSRPSPDGGSSGGSVDAATPTHFIPTGTGDLWWVDAVNGTVVNKVAMHDAGTGDGVARSSTVWTLYFAGLELSTNLLWGFGLNGTGATGVGIVSVDVVSGLVTPYPTANPGQFVPCVGTLVPGASSSTLVFPGAPGEGVFTAYLFDTATHATRAVKLPATPWPTYSRLAQFAAVGSAPSLDAAPHSSWDLVALTDSSRSTDLLISMVDQASGSFGPPLVKAALPAYIASGSPAVGTSDGVVFTLAGGGSARSASGGTASGYHLVRADLATGNITSVVASQLPATGDQLYFGLGVAE